MKEVKKKEEKTKMFFSDTNHETRKRNIIFDTRKQTFSMKDHSVT